MTRIISKWQFIFMGVMMFCTATANAAIGPEDLIKVTPEIEASCVEYYSYQGEAYCSTTTQQPQAIDPHLHDNEKLIINFDQRPWQAVWGEQTPQGSTIEYIPMGDNINQWHELITSQYFPGRQQIETPSQYAQSFITRLESAGFKPIIKFYKTTPNQVVFEFRILTPEDQQQDELQMVMQDGQALYVLHYVIKESDMGEKNRDKWLKNLENTKVK